MATTLTMGFWHRGAVRALALSGALLLATGATADVEPYEGIPADQAETVTTEAQIYEALQSGLPTAIWHALEHAEVVECMGCIDSITPLLYDKNARTREIAAWWLRRRIFGVFGPGEVYEETLNTLANDPNAVRRAAAASAVGEFLVLAGVSQLATALTGDADPGVRAAAATALGRIGDDGGGALATAFSDSDAGVRRAALVAAGRINSFTDVASAAATTGDADAIVRRLGVELLETLVATDSAEAVLTLAQSDPNSEVRLVSCHALGVIGDASMASDLLAISQHDANPQVQDQARIASVRLSP
jgi:hypothetical protein